MNAKEKRGRSRISRVEGDALRTTLVAAQEPFALEHQVIRPGKKYMIHPVPMQDRRT